MNSIKTSEHFIELLRIVEKLRSPNGCEWDRKQNHESLIPYLTEEVYEVIESIDEKDWNNLQEELGDVLLHIILQIQIAKESSLFTVDDVVKFVELCVDKQLIIDFILKDELDSFIKPTNSSGVWVRQQIDGVRIKAVNRDGYTIYAIWMRESLMKEYVAYLESIKKTLSDASAFSFPVI